MQNNIFNERVNCFAVNTISKPCIIHHTNHSFSLDSILLPTASTNVSPERGNVLQRENYSKRSGTGRTAMIDIKPKIRQWEVSNSVQASDSNTDRCLSGRLGSQLHGYRQWGKMVSRREEIACKYPGTASVEECHLSFYKREDNQCNSYPEQQHNCPIVPSENGRYDRQDTCRLKLGRMEISDIKADPNSCRISPTYSEHKSRLAVSS